MKKTGILFTSRNNYELLDLWMSKIDTEGFEFEVLRGLGKYLGKITSLMVEVTEKHEEVLQLMKRSGYKPFNASLCPVSETEVKGWTNNMFFVLKSDC